MMTFVNMNSPALADPAHASRRSQPALVLRESLPQFRPQLFRHRRSRLLARRCPRHRYASRVRTCRNHHSRRHAEPRLPPAPPQPAAPASLRRTVHPPASRSTLCNCINVLLENVLGLTEESIRNQQNISYVRDAAGGPLARDEGSPRANIVFLMNPCRIDASPRHRLCRRSHAPEIHRLLPQASQRTDGLCAGLTGRARVGTAALVCPPGKARHPPHLAHSRFA